MFNEDLVFLDQDIQNSEDLLRFSFKHLKEMGYVKDGYLQSIMDREKEFPTGLKTHVGIDVAIPHTEVDFAEQEAVVFIRTKEKIKFNHMVDPDEEVSTNLIFNIVVKNPKEQVVFLTKLMKIFQNKELMEFLLKENNKKAIVERLTVEIK